MSSLDSPVEPAPPLAELTSLKGRVAAITGASTGIGLASARRLAEGGADVVLLDINVDKAKEEAAQISAEFGVRCDGIECDASDPASIRAAIDHVLSEFGALHIWVNNAGIFPAIPALEITDEQYDELMDLDLRGAFLAMRDAAKAMLANPEPRGVVINMVSVSGLIAATNSAHYVAAKHAMAGATKAFARDLAPQGIRVLGVAPTLIRTPGVIAGLADPVSRPALEAFIEQIPLGHPGESDDVARVVFFAASELASFMTGSTLVVDGGELVL